MTLAQPLGYTWRKMLALFLLLSLGSLRAADSARAAAEAEFDKVKELGTPQDKPLIEIPGQKP